MPPAPHEYKRSRADSVLPPGQRSLERPRTLRLVDTRASNQPAFGAYLNAPDSAQPYAAP